MEAITTAIRSPAESRRTGPIELAVGGGIITMALFPLALPLLALTAIAALPLLVPVLAAGLLIGVVALPVLLVRVAIRALRRKRRPIGVVSRFPLQQDLIPPGCGVLTILRCPSRSASACVGGRDSPTASVIPLGRGSFRVRGAFWVALWEVPGHACFRYRRGAPR